ncbi:hypothetical protein [Tissierella pigra]|uniref:Uncharacterized protein n=1 Tax=Tissierella pigra TaxID=2607614 RepID=A0A6N7XIP9_9FIRM|nr:hypothetical protein [Tissierella pigra]MSU01951.1 hypothetical protein [Tissierella pigra]
MDKFIFGLIVGSMRKKSNGYENQSVTPPKPPLPPIPNKISKRIISLKFCKEFDWNSMEIIELNSYREFFIFYIENHDKGYIYDVKLRGVANELG